MSTAALIVALIVTFIAAAIQGVVGMGFAMVSVPILALIHPSLAPVPQLLITLPLTILMAWRERRHIELSGLGWIVGGRIPGAFLGVGLLAVATQQTLDIAIAAVVLGAVAIIASGFHVRRSPVSEFGAGVLSGVSGFVASIGGPPLALLYARDDGPTVRSNLAAIFSIGLVITISARVLSGNISWTDVRVALILFPALAVGYLVSVRFKSRVSQPLVRGAILVLSLVGAIGLIIRAIV
ncbi:MAG: sulfite exporter TauE/SafE family protein [Actinomycetota bacterium]|nr:sulfite exporter TauE/SafE family protein [Actinomycetota bacterium]